MADCVTVSTVELSEEDIPGAALEGEREREHDYPLLTLVCFLFTKQLNFR